MAWADGGDVRPAHGVACLLVALPLGACLEMEQTIVIAADGSGSQKLRLGMTEAVLTEARRAAAVTAPDGGSSPAQVFDRAAVERELADTGLALRSHRTFDRGGKRFVELEVGFGGIAALRRSPLSGTAPQWEFAPGPVPGTIQATLYPQGRQAWDKARQQAEQIQSLDDPVARAFVDKRRQQLAGLDVTLHLELPGRVLRWTRNMEKTGERTVTARIRADQIQTPADLVRRLAPRFEIVIEAAGCTFPLDGR
jgi:hypothetical protein